MDKKEHFFYENSILIYNMIIKDELNIKKEVKDLLYEDLNITRVNVERTKCLSRQNMDSKKQLLLVELDSASERDAVLKNKHKLRDSKKYDPPVFIRP